MGSDIHRAARIAAAGHGGQVLVSASTAALLDLELDDLGEHRLEGPRARRSAFSSSETATFPPLRSLVSHESSRPRDAVHRAESASSRTSSSSQRRDDVRLLTLTGPGGTGKTRLALAGGGRSFVTGIPKVSGGYRSLPCATRALVLETASQVLGATNGSCRAHCATGACSVLFDNFEQVVDAAPRCRRAPGRVPTPRRPRHEPGALTRSRRADILGSASRAGRRSGAVHVLAPVPSIPHSTKAMRPGSSACGSTSCRSRSSSPPPVRRSLRPSSSSHASPSVSTCSRGSATPTRDSRRLRATIDWSYDLLTEPEQGLLARLAVFAGGCSYEAAEQIAGADPDTLQSLARQEPPPQARVALHDSLLDARDDP